MCTSGGVDNLLKSAEVLCALGDGLNLGTNQTDVANEIEPSKDGSLVAFPAIAP